MNVHVYYCNYYCSLYYILPTYFFYYIFVGPPACFTMALPPHKLVKVAGQLVAVATSHSLELDLHPVPIALDILCMNTSRGVNKMEAVVYGSVA